MKNKVPVPKCGESDKRNRLYEETYEPKKFYKNLIKSTSPIIFDVGAHKGESINFFKSIFPRSLIYSFEPNPNNFTELDKVSKKFKTKAFQKAISNKTGSIDFFSQGISHLGGLLPIKSDSKDSLGYSINAPNNLIRVESVTLNKLTRDIGITNIDILKIDVQGFELGVLKGASKILKNTNIVVVEISLYDFYGDNSKNWFLVNAFLGKYSFELWDIAKLSKNPKNLRTDWAELVFRKV